MWEIPECQKYSVSLQSALGYQGQDAGKSWNNLHKRETVCNARYVYVQLSEHTAAMQLRKGTSLRQTVEVQY